MVAKSFAATLALASAASAAPALAGRQDYACNPAHSYPNGASCVSTNGALSLVTPVPTTTAYACNPAHSYPGGVSCVSTNGALSLVTPAPAATTYACNPAHSYPGGVSCVSTNGALSLVSPTKAIATSAATSAVAVAGTAAGAAAPGSNPKKEDGKYWSVEHLTRYCLDNTGCDYNFGLNAQGKSGNCTVIRMPGSNAATESWSGQNCTIDGTTFKVSWGYVANPAPAFAVMTIVDGKELAWFGVSDVNGQKVTPSNPYGSGDYGNLAPEPVYVY
ncbi:hypothetical protein KCU91_g987, partial [Aureobasidium melanogenum]